VLVADWLLRGARNMTGQLPPEPASIFDHPLSNKGGPYPFDVHRRLETATTRRPIDGVYQRVTRDVRVKSLTARQTSIAAKCNLLP
jgi:hypothetical protein